MAKQTFVSAQVLTAAQMTTLQANDYNQTVSTKTASYTLIASDAGTKVVMNSASATTITVNTSLFTAGDTLTILNIGAGVCTLTAGTATVSSTGSLALSQYAGGTLYFISAGVSVFQANGITASPAGLAVVKAETAFTTSSAVNVDNVFTSTYTNYLVKIIYTTSSTVGVRFKLRASGTATITNYNRQELSVTDTSVAGSRTASTTSVLVGLDTNGDFKASTDVTLFGPNLAQPTLINAFSGGAFRGAYTTPAIYLGGHNQSASTQFDGIEFNTDSPGTITGTYAVYGYSKAV